jgi:hypothetical protein
MQLRVISYIVIFIQSVGGIEEECSHHRGDSEAGAGVHQQ